MADLKDILSHNEELLSDEELLKYLDDILSEEDKYAVEKKLADDPFEADALEGLSQIENKENLKKQVTQLKQKLHQQLSAKKQRKEKKNINVIQWVILTILILLFICIISYVIISMQKNNAHTQLLHLTSELTLLV